MKGYIINRIDKYPYITLRAPAIASSLNLSLSMVEKVLDEMDQGKDVIRKSYLYSCSKTEIALAEYFKPREKVYCAACGKKHSLDRETLDFQVVYRQRDAYAKKK